jgi:hypothetical protein
MKMELRNLITQVSHEREIEPERLVAALEDAISQAARKHYRERGVQTLARSDHRRDRRGGH